ncbi:hypothetical protein MKX01_035176 [Papaver californicum]|nr:hypothetical protein MKX01_035176 [Papaver californicum]
MRFSKFERGNQSSDSDFGYKGESSKRAKKRISFKNHMKSKQAERRFTYSSKNHIKSKSCSKSFTYKNIIYKNAAYKSTSPNVLRKQTQLSSNSSEEYGVLRKRRFHCQKHNSQKKNCKRRKLHNEAVFMGDSDYVKFLKSLTGDKENDEDDSDNDSESQNEGYDDVVNDEDSDDDEKNEDIHVDIDIDMDMDMGGGYCIGVGNELNPDDFNEEDVEENEDIQLDMDMGGEYGDGIDVGDELDPQYKMFLENLREDGKSYILEMESDKGDFISIKYEEPLLPPSWSKGKSMPVNECKMELTLIAKEIISGSLIVRIDDIILPIGEHNKVKSVKDGFPCTEDLQFEEDNMNTISNLGKSVKDGLRYCKDPSKKPKKPQKSCDSQTDEDDLGTDCSRSKYEKELGKCINMPYDEKELVDKWELASPRMEVERVRETRRRSVSYATEKTGLSYLDHHPELYLLVFILQLSPKWLIAIFEYGDGCRALLLLRCLFFYNENVAHEGAFMSWVDPSFERMLLDPA